MIFDRKYTKHYIYFSQNLPELIFERKYTKHITLVNQNWPASVLLDIPYSKRNLTVIKKDIFIQTLKILVRAGKTVETSAEVTPPPPYFRQVIFTKFFFWHVYSFLLLLKNMSFMNYVFVMRPANHTLYNTLYQIHDILNDHYIYKTIIENLSCLL